MNNQQLLIRIDKLEKSNRIHRIMIMLSCMAMLSAFMSNKLGARGQDVAARTVLAEEFILVDSKSNTIGQWKSELSNNGKGFPALVMKRDDFNTKLSPHSLVFNSNNDPLAGLYINDTSVGIRDNNRKTRVLLDRFGMSLHDPLERPRILLGSTGDDGLRKKAGIEQAESELVFYKTDGKIAHKLPE